jgi:hypothetical protein
MSNVIFLLMIVISVAYVALPYFRKKTISQSDTAKKNGRLTDLHSRRDTLLAAIKEIEFDHAMGKISTQDFAEMNARYREEAVAVLKRIDALNGSNGAAQKLEAELRAARKASRRTLCSACGGAIDAKDRFCSHCGQRLRH